MRDVDLSYDRGRIDARDQSRKEIVELRKMLDEAADRIEQLEAALRAVIVRCEEGDKKFDWLPTISNIAHTALDNLCEDEGCPNAGTPHVCINRQENDDVFPGFRGNNEA